jgi:hypothetical protein
MTALHLEDVRDQIARALDPKMEATGGAPAPAAGPRPSDAGVGNNAELVDDDVMFVPSNLMDPFAADRGCWHDYAIRRDELATQPSRP